MTRSDWCRILGIDRPTLEEVTNQPDANTFARLIVVLLEHGEPTTLEAAAERFEAAGIATRKAALLALKRCRPARPPVYRDGDRYYLDPHDADLDLWCFRLGLRPARVQPRVDEPASEPRAPLPGPDVALQLDEIREVLSQPGCTQWSNQRLIVATLDASDEPLSLDQVRDALSQHGAPWAGKIDLAFFRRRNSPIDVLDDGRLALGSRSATAAAVRSARKAFRDRLEMLRRHAAGRPDPAAVQRTIRRLEEERERDAAELAKLARVLVTAFPRNHPIAAAIVDVGTREIRGFGHGEFDALRDRLAEYDVIGAVEARPLLDALGFDPGDRRVADLRPPQKSISSGRSGRAVKVTLDALTRGSCGLRNAFHDEAALARMAERGDAERLLGALEQDLRSLHAMYEYGRLHGALRIRHRNLDEMLPVPWAYRHEHRLHDLMSEAFRYDLGLEAVVGSPADWDAPWEDATQLRIGIDPQNRLWLVDDDREIVDRWEVLAARLPAPRRVR